MGEAGRGCIVILSWYHICRDEATAIAVMNRLHKALQFGFAFIRIILTIGFTMAM
jgi:hypothetical protein